MQTFDAPDGTRLACSRTGGGSPLVCLPGGPMQAAAYLGDLGGLSAHRPLVPLDLRAHSAGAALALLYAARHPERIGRLVLVTPSPRVVGLAVTDDDRRAVAEPRRDERWFPEAFAAFERIWSGRMTDDDWTAITPFTFGRWDAAARASVALAAQQRNDDAAAPYYADGAFDAGAVRAALGGLPASVLVVAGEHDVALPPGRAAEYAGLFPEARLTVQPGAGHYPWLDDPESFVATVAAFT